MRTRRDILKAMGSGFGMASLSSLLAAPSRNPLDPRAPHFPAKAKHVIYLFLNGGPSQVDTFDPKPQLTKFHGTLAPAGNLKTERKTGTLLKSPFERIEPSVLGKFWDLPGLFLRHVRSPAVERRP